MKITAVATVNAKMVCASATSTPRRSEGQHHKPWAFLEVKIGAEMGCTNRIQPRSSNLDISYRHIIFRLFKYMEKMRVTMHFSVRVFLDANLCGKFGLIPGSLKLSFVAPSRLTGT